MLVLDAEDELDCMGDECEDSVKMGNARLYESVHKLYCIALKIRNWQPHSTYAQTKNQKVSGSRTIANLREASVYVTTSSFLQA
jgi:hypothetical protein